MRTQELIDLLRKYADNIEEQLENDEISENLNLQPNTYGLSTPFIASRYGFVELDNATGEDE